MTHNPPKPSAYSYVRFSRPEQLRGDSLRRQKQLSQEYAEKNGLNLVESMEDLGVSAFRGKNAVEGALAGFLAAVKAGKITRGSYLLIESLDRLSRQAVMDALPRFLDLINAGVVVVTLKDGAKYDRANMEPMQIVISIMEMMRANEESATKSNRLAKAWEQKRANIGTQKLTKLCPGWLRLSDDGTRYEPIPERVRIIRRIYAETINGKGRQVIANQFNAEGVAPWGIGRKKGEGWNGSYVTKILANRAVLGEFVPHRLINGKRVSTETVVKDYFPRVIEDNEFYLAHASSARRAIPVGCVSVTSANLFEGVGRCGVCGGTLCYADKGGGEKYDWRYLKCSRTARKLANCEPSSHRYARIERLFLEWVAQYDFSGGESNVRKQKEEELLTVSGQKSEAQHRLDRFNEALAVSDAPVKSIVSRIQAAENEIELLTNTEALLRAEIEQAENAAGTVDFHSLAKETDGRFRLRAEIKRRVQSVTIYPEGWREGSMGEEPWFGQWCLFVELKDGKRIIVYGNDRVEWVENGKRTRWEEGADDPDRYSTERA